MDRTETDWRTDYLTAEDVIGMLDIRLQTLYAYVSRGLIRSVEQAGQKKRLYLRDDVEKVQARSLARAGHGPVAASAMNLGEPIIPTSITEISPQGPRYRGHLAVNLMQEGARFEQVAELLWTGLWHDEPVRWPVVPQVPELRKLAASISAPQTADQLLETFALFVLRLGMTRGTIADRVRIGNTLDAARGIIQTLTGCFGYISARQSFQAMLPGQSIVDGLVRSLGVKDTKENRAAFEAILMLLADHELSPATFAARVAASCGSALHSCIVSAICAGSGVHVGRLYDRVETFFARASTKAVLLRRAERFLDAGNAVPGFGHPLYPHGDPRSQALLDIARRRKGASRQVDAIFGFIDEAQAKYGLHPRHELAVTTLAISMGLPQHSAGGLFTLARTAGWVAHVHEQRLSGTLLRPRAKFI
ncbi:MAG: citrate synthase [Pseudomonadota bacterium]